jgi:hypothetical protein
VPVSIEDHKWAEREKYGYEKSYINMYRDFLYVKDTYSDGLEPTQTEPNVSKEGRYEVRLIYKEDSLKSDGQIIDTFMDWGETREFLDRITQ